MASSSQAHTEMGLKKAVSACNVTSLFHAHQVAPDCPEGNRFKDVMKNHNTALSVVAALLMTIVAPGLLSPNDDFLDECGAAQYVYVISALTSFLSGMLCVWFGTYAYFKLNMTPDHQIKNLWQILWRS